MKRHGTSFCTFFVLAPTSCLALHLVAAPLPSVITSPQSTQPLHVESAHDVGTHHVVPVVIVVH